MAEALLRNFLPDGVQGRLVIGSAGTYAQQEGGADPRAIAVAEEFGASLESHRRRPLTTELISQAGTIFVMDYVNEAEVLACDSTAMRKLVLLGELGEGKYGGSAEIPDPFTGTPDDIRRCYASIRSCVRNLASIIARREGIAPEWVKLR